MEKKVIPADITITNLTVPINKLTPHPKNYRKHPEDQMKNLRASYRLFGQFRSIIAVPTILGEYLIIAGHGMVEAMKREGAATVRIEALPVDVDDITIEGIMIADNQHALKSVQNDEILAQLLSSQKDDGVILEALGSSEKELNQLLLQVANSHATDFLAPFLETPMPVPTGSSSIKERETVGIASNQPTLSQQSPYATQPLQQPQLPYADTTQYFTMTYTFTMEQREIVLQAIKQAKQEWYVETSAEAIMRICQRYVNGE